ncbi:MAG: methyltransferase type 11, partial [Planctomycetota bacterium]
DLVICNDVLPALEEAPCVEAIANLTELTRGVLFLGAMTREDWARCDKRRSDPRIHLRSAAWYRAQLEDGFIALGGGLFAKRDAPITHWSLDCLE